MQIQLSFLYVGHTHEDIDQLFSQISRLMRRNEAQTLPDLQALLPHATEIFGMLDMKSWIEPHIHVVSGHTKPLHYRFKEAGSGPPTIEYRGNSKQRWKKIDASFWKTNPSGKNFEYIIVQMLWCTYD